MTLGSELDELRRRYDRCFGCGRSNPLGLQLDGFERSGDDGIEVPWRPREAYQGFDGMLHGGIVAAALDESMAWAAMVTEGVLVYTGTLEFRYRAKAPVDADYRLMASVGDRRGSRLRIRGALHLAGEDNPVATADGLFVVAGELSDVVGEPS